MDISVILREIPVIFFTLFIVIDPLGVVPMYISVCNNIPENKRITVIFRAVVVAFIVSVIFIFLGKAILELLKIHPGSFYIAGGIMLFLVALDMLFGAPKRTKSSDQENDFTDAAIFPLAIPGLAGPGSITTILIFITNPAATPMTPVIVAGSILVTLLAAAVTMFSSTFLLRALGKTGVSVIERIMGIILAGMAIQFVYDGAATLLRELPVFPL